MMLYRLIENRNKNGKGNWTICQAVKHRSSLNYLEVIFCLLLVICLWPMPSAYGKEAIQSSGNPNESIVHSAGLSELIQFAYENNPSIHAARKSWQATVESYRVTTGYPDPQLSVTYFPDPIETRLGPQDWNMSISQKIPFPGRLSKAGEVVSAEAEISRLKLDKTYRDVLVSIRESYHELQYIRKAKKVAEQNMQLLSHLRKVSETAYADNSASLLDVVKAQSQTGQLRYDNLLLEDLEKTEIARMNGLLNRAPGAVIGKLETESLSTVVYPLDDIYALAEIHQEEIKIASAQIEKAGKMVALARYKNYPDFKVGVFYAGIGNPDVSSPPPNAGDDAFGITAGVTLPLWFGKNKSRVARERAYMAVAQAEKTVRVNETHTQIRARYFRLENARRLVDLYQKDLLPQAAVSMEQAETWFKQGESSFSDFIETQAVWYNFQLALARAQADYGKQLARLERLAGRSLTTKDTVVNPLMDEEAK